jgi:type I restriction enzyme S subunit
MISTGIAKDLSGSWIETTFGEIAEYVTSGSRDWSKYYSDQGVLFIRTQDINTNRLRLCDTARVSLPEKVEGKRTRVHPGDILITITGANVGKVALVEGEIEEAYVSQSVALVRLKDKRFGKFLHYQLTTKFKGDKTHLESMAYGLGRPVLNLSNIRDVPIRLAPLDQQKRIVAEIEKQFSRLDEVVTNLHRVKANLKRYKTAVLKAAVEGRLVETEAELARREGRSYETGAQLLQRILETRCSHWKGKVRYKEPLAPYIRSLPELPPGWVWANLEQLTWLITSGSRGWGSSYSDSGALFVRAQDIKTDVLNLRHVARVIVPEHAEGTRSRVDSGDILITITGANVAKSALVQKLGERAYVSQHVALLKFNSPEAAPFVFTWIVSPSNGRKSLESLAYGAGKPGLSLGQLRYLCVPIPPLAEQHRILTEVEFRLSMLRSFMAQLKNALDRCARLRMSHLRSTFDGRLDLT